MSEHTPGPWIIETEPYNVWTKYGVLIARCNAPLKPESRWQEGCANARLIAAAPELLAVARRAIANCACAATMRPDVPCLSCAARAAIAQAEGGGA